MCTETNDVVDLKDDADVPVTRALLAMARLVRASFQMYLFESLLGEALGRPVEQHARDRCRDEFFGKYLEIVKEVGLSPNEVTFRAILEHDAPEELDNVLYADMPMSWVFNPWRGWRKVP